LADHSRTQIFLHLDSGIFPIQTLNGTEAVNECLDLTVTTSSRLTSGFASDESRSLIGSFASLQLRSGDTERWWHCDIAEIHESWDHGRHSWTLTLTNKLQRGTLQTRTQLWMHVSRKELVYRLLEEIGYYRYEITWQVDEVIAPEGPFLQVQESNYDFLKRLLAEIGANFWFNHDPDPLHEQLIISNTPYQSKYLPNIEWVQSVSGLSPSHRRNRIVSILPEFNVVPARYGAATNDALLHTGKADALQHSLTPREKVNHEQFTPPRPDVEAAQRALYAQQYANQKALILEIVSHQPRLTAGHSLTIESRRYLGYKLATGDIRLQRVQHKASSLSDGSGLEYSNFAVAIPRETPIRPKQIELQNLPQFFAARIESPYEHAHLTKQGYYRFRPDFEAPSERSPYGHTQASPVTERILPYSGPRTDKGKAVGWHFPMLNQSTLFVTCLNNDPYRMAIVGFVPSWEQEGPVTANNRTQHRIVTSSQNELLMDDSPKSHRFALFTFDGQTMLNMFDNDKEHYIQLTSIYGGINLNASLNVQMTAQESIAFESGQSVGIKAKQQASIRTENDAISMQSAKNLTLESKNNLTLTSTEGDVSVWAKTKPITQHAGNGFTQTVSAGNANSLVQGGTATVQVNGGEIQLESQGDIVITDGTGGIKIDSQGNIKLWGSNIYFDSNSVTVEGDIEYDSGGNEPESAPELQAPELTETALLEFDPVEALEGEPGRYSRSKPRPSNHDSIFKESVSEKIQDVDDLYITFPGDEMPLWQFCQQVYGTNNSRTATHLLDSNPQLAMIGNRILPGLPVIIAPINSCHRDLEPLKQKAIDLTLEYLKLNQEQREWFAEHHETTIDTLLITATSGLDQHEGKADSDDLIPFSLDSMILASTGSVIAGANVQGGKLNKRMKDFAEYSKDVAEKTKGLSKQALRSNEDYKQWRKERTRFQKEMKKLLNSPGNPSFIKKLQPEGVNNYLNIGKKQLYRAKDFSSAISGIDMTQLYKKTMIFSKGLGVGGWVVTGLGLYGNAKDTYQSCKMGDAISEVCEKSVVRNGASMGVNIVTGAAIGWAIGAGIALAPITGGVSIIVVAAGAFLWGLYGGDLSNKAGIYAEELIYD
jgi:Uncharacterized protein conserved in bacteria